MFYFFVSDVISEVVSGLFGPLHLALGPNHQMAVFRSSFIQTRLKSESYDT